MIAVFNFKFMRLGVPESILVASAILAGGCEGEPVQKPVSMKAPIIESVAGKTTPVQKKASEAPSAPLSAEDRTRAECEKVRAETEQAMSDLSSATGQWTPGMGKQPRYAEQDCLAKHGLFGAKKVQDPIKIDTRAPRGKGVGSEL